jgi:MICOS complex subunit MIC60
VDQRRNYAERSDALLSSDPAFKPDAPTLKPQVPLVQGGPGSPAPSPATPSSTTSVPAQKPITVPVSASKIQTAPPTTTANTIPPEVPPTTSASPPPEPPAPAPRKRFRKLRALFYLILLSALTYGGAAFYALRSDNFHDFFTEYIPFGEDVVLFFEEKSFQRRFPNAKQNMMSATRSTDPQSKITIPKKSGLSWKVQEEEKGSTDVSQKGKHMSALDANNRSNPDAKESKSEFKGAKPTIVKSPEEVLSDPAKAPSEEKKQAQKAIVPANAGKSSDAETVVTERPAPKPEEMPQPSPATPSPKSDPRPPALAPVTAISSLEVPNADEPVVQDLVKIINDLITVVNADAAEITNKYSAPMSKAKEALTDIASKISTLRDAERKAAEERVQQAHKEFDEGAKQLLQRIETAQREDDARYREEFEAERARIAESYDEKLKNEIQRSKEVSEARLHNELAEQAIKMKRDFVDEIKSLVEAERNGRLSKLSDLSSNVDNLTELTSNWNGVIDSNLATQKLQVAVDSVRSALVKSNWNETKPQPFVREMAALKLVADGDAIVDAAIASVNPSAYQRGIPSQPQLIDRFRNVASEVRKASLLPEDAGIASHAASFVLSRVMFKKRGQPQGGDVESILTRTETLLEEGDLDGAAREMNGLEGWAKVLSRDWLGDVRKVLEVRQALDVIETEARLQCLRVE